MLEIILMVLTTFGFVSADVKLLELPQESKNFGASIKDYYKTDNIGNYTYIYQNEDGSKQRQDGNYGEKRGYYTFKAPLPNGQTFTVCYYTKNGYHAKTTIIEIDDIESYCDMIIEQIGNIKTERKPVNGILLKFKSNENHKENIEIQSTLEDSETKLSRKNGTLNMSFTNKSLTQKERSLFSYSKTPNLSRSNSFTVFGTQTPDVKTKLSLLRNRTIENQTNSKDFEITLPSPLQIPNELQKNSTSLTTETSLRKKLITSIDESNSTKISSNLNNTKITDTKNNIDKFSLPNEQYLNKNLFMLFNISDFQIPIEKNYEIFCNKTMIKNNNQNSGCNINAFPNPMPNKTKVEMLLAEIPKYGLRKNAVDKNNTEILQPSKLFLPPYVDDDMDVPPFLDLISSINNEKEIARVKENISKNLKSEARSQSLFFQTITTIPTPAVIVEKESFISHENKTGNRKLIPPSTKVPAAETLTKTKTVPFSRNISSKFTASTKITRNPNFSTKNFISENHFNLLKINRTKATDYKINDSSIKRPSLDLIPFDQPSFNLLPPLEKLTDNIGDIPANRVSRSVPSVSNLETDCKYSALHTDTTGKFEYIKLLKKLKGFKI